MGIGTRRADLVIGRDAEAIVELKLEPFITDAGRVDLKEIRHDIRKLDAYAKQGSTGHFIMIELEGLETTTGPWYFPRQTVKFGIPEKERRKTKHFTWVHYKAPPKKQHDDARLNHSHRNESPLHPASSCRH